MKRLLLSSFLIGIGLAGVFALKPGSLSGQSPAGSNPLVCPADKACKGKTCAASTRKVKDDADVVAELVAIMDQTKSSDTYMAALLALARFEDKTPFPAVVRNAERLGLLKGLCKDENPSHAQQMIGAYLSGEMAADCEPGCPKPYGAPPVPSAYPLCPPNMPMYPPPPARSATCAPTNYAPTYVQDSPRVMPATVSPPSSLLPPLPSASSCPEPVCMPRIAVPTVSQSAPKSASPSYSIPDAYELMGPPAPADSSSAKDAKQVFSFFLGFSR